jgi:hypothetical protein
VNLHYLFDLWADVWRKRVAKGDVIVVRYADDLVVGFQHRAEAERFLKEFRERLAKFGLELHPDKTRLAGQRQTPIFASGEKLGHECRSPTIALHQPAPEFWRRLGFQFARRALRLRSTLLQELAFQSINRFVGQMVLLLGMGHPEAGEQRVNRIEREDRLPENKISLRRVRLVHKPSHSGPKVVIIPCDSRDFRGSQFQVVSVASNCA